MDFSLRTLRPHAPAHNARKTHGRCPRWPALTATIGALLLLLAGCPKLAPTHSGEQEEGARPLLLWEVSKEDEEPDYLMGTCHLAVALSESLPESMWNLVNQADVVVMEVDQTQLRLPEVAQRLRLEGLSLDQLLPPGVWDQLAEAYELGPLADRMNQMHPFVVLSYVMKEMAMADGGPGTQGSKPMELELLMRAAEQGLRLSYLETVHEQLDIFLGRPMERWLEGLEQLVDPAEQGAAVEELATVLSVCRTGDLAVAQTILRNSEKEDAEWNERLLGDRNRAWIPKLEAYFGEGQAFVAVGAGHMMGSDGVVALLRARGYQVRQMHGVTLTREEASAAWKETEEQGPISREFFLEFFTPRFSQIICQEEGVFMPCYDAPAERCLETSQVAVAACADEIGLPEEISGSDAPEWGKKLGTCAGEHLARGLEDARLDTPECLALEAPEEDSSED